MGFGDLEYQRLETDKTMTHANGSDLTPKSAVEKPDSILARAPGLKILNNQSIAVKLNLGFGLLVLLTLFGAGISYLGSTQATVHINRTEDVRVPTALASSEAQADLLRMLAAVHGYLALGQGEFQETYVESRQAFEQDLAELEALSPNFSVEDRALLQQLRATFGEWSSLPAQLFSLRDDQLEREPAYALLATDGIRTAGDFLIGLENIIDIQTQREPSISNVNLLNDMGDIQSSFTAMLSGLRGYATTRNRIYKQEYFFNRDLNGFAWNRLQNRSSSLTPDQQALLKQIAERRQTFLAVPDEMFALLESDQWRRDLYLFSTVAVPLTDEMQGLLANITENQQLLLQTDLNQGRRELSLSNQRILVGGSLAVLLGIALAFIFQANIARPIRGLTNVADRIRQGNLDAKAQVTSRDETGTLADTFNRMTTQLRDTLFSVQSEKQRADNLLDVVIPIGVSLASETDFNKLLENILLEAKSFCNADAGTLYLYTEDNHLAPMIVRNDTLNVAMGGTTGNDVALTPLALFDPETGKPNDTTLATRAALSGDTSCVASHANDMTDSVVAGPAAMNWDVDYAVESILSIPLKNSEQRVLGVMQLINAQDRKTGKIVLFDATLQQMMESFSSLAVAALEAYIREQSLKQEIQQLRIEIDEVKRNQQVSEIVESDFFLDLQNRARVMRQRRTGAAD